MRKKPGAWTCRRATIPHTQNASNTCTCVYMYKVHTLYLRFGLINHIFPKAFCANIRYQKIQLLKTKHDAFFAVQQDLFHFIFTFTVLGNPRPVSHYII